MAQKFFELVKSSNFYAPSKHLKMPPVWFATEFNGAWVKGPDVTSNREHDDSVVRIFTCFGREGCESSSKNCQPGALQGGYSNSTNLQEVLRFISYRFYVGMIVLKRRKRRVDFVKAKCAKRERERAWIFRKRKGFYRLRGLSKTN